VSIVDGIPEEPGSGTSDMNHKRFGRFHSSTTVNGELHISYEPWSVPHMAFSVLGEPAVVAVNVAADVTIVTADRVGQLECVLPCRQRSVMFTKRSGFHFKSG